MTILTNPDKSLGNWIDIFLVFITVVTLSIALQTWFQAMTVFRDDVYYATIIPLVISLVLVLNIAVLVVLRLQRRVDQLEGGISVQNDLTINLEALFEKAILFVVLVLIVVLLIGDRIQ